MKKTILFFLLTFTALVNAQILSKDLFPADGTTRDSFLVGRRFKHTMLMDRAKRLELQQGNLAMWDTAKKAFIPVKAFRLDGTGMVISFDSTATYKYYDIDRKQWLTWRVDSVYTTTKQNTDNISFQADRVTTLFFGLDTLYASMQSSFKIQAGEIEAKVSETDYNGKTIASLINLQPDSIKIQSKNIELDGKVIFKAISGGTDSTVIDGKYFKTGSVLADSIRARYIYGLTLIGNTIKGGSLYSKNWNSSIGSFFDLDNGGFYLGGSANPKLSWNGSALSITGNINATGGNFSGTITGGTFTGGSYTTEDVGSGFAYLQNNALYLVSDGGYSSLSHDSHGVWCPDGINVANDYYINGTSLSDLFAPANHTHPVSQITGLQSILDNLDNRVGSIEGSTLWEGHYETITYKDSYNNNHTINVWVANQ